MTDNDKLMFAVEVEEPITYLVQMREEGPGRWAWCAARGSTKFASGTLTGNRDRDAARATVEADVKRLHDDEDTVIVNPDRVRELIKDLEARAKGDENRAWSRSQGQAFYRGRAVGYELAAQFMRHELLGVDVSAEQVRDIREDVERVIARKRANDEAVRKISGMTRAEYAADVTRPDPHAEDDLDYAARVAGGDCVADNAEFMQDVVSRHE